MLPHFLQSAGWHRWGTRWRAWASSWDTQRCSHSSYESAKTWATGLAHEHRRRGNKSNPHSHKRAPLTARLGVKGDASIIEGAPEEEVRERREGVESDDKSGDDEKDEAHRSLSGRHFYSVLHSIPPLPVATAWKKRISTKSKQQPLQLLTFSDCKYAQSYFKRCSWHISRSALGDVSALIRNFLWCRAGELLFSHHASWVIMDSGVEDGGGVVPVNDVIAGR